MVQHIHIQCINKSKNKNDLSLSTDAEKTFAKSIPFHDKSSEETRNRRSVPQHNKGYMRNLAPTSY
jgi:hypothetical protein